MCFLGEMGMSVEVRVPTVLRKHTGGARVVQAQGDNVAAVLENLEQQFPGLKQEVMNEDGQVRQFVNIYVNDEDIRYLQSLQTALQDGDSVAILPAVAGGAPLPPNLRHEGGQGPTAFPHEGEGHRGGAATGWPVEAHQDS